MKWLITIISILTLAFGPSQAFSQNGPEEVVYLLSTQDEKRISFLFNDQVQIYIGKSKGLFSKAQAARILNSFFDKNDCIVFSPQKVKRSAYNRVIVQGLYKSHTEQFKVTCVLGHIDGQFIIQNLMIIQIDS